MESGAITANGSLALKLYMTQNVTTATYTVTWFDSQTGAVLKGPESRTGTIGADVSITAADKTAVAGATYNGSDPRRVESGTVTANGRVISVDVPANSFMLLSNFS